MKLDEKKKSKLINNIKNNLNNINDVKKENEKLFNEYDEALSLYIKDEVTESEFDKIHVKIMPIRSKIREFERIAILNFLLLVGKENDDELARYILSSVVKREEVVNRLENAIYSVENRRKCTLIDIL